MMDDASPAADHRFIFGYGSLIFRPGFAPAAAHPGYISGFKRRFWQSSPDHRGTELAPGRVCTLIKADDEHTAALVHGMLYELPAADAGSIFRALQHREQAGYETLEVYVHCRDGVVRHAITFAATAANSHWVGPPPSTYRTPWHLREADYVSRRCDCNEQLLCSAPIAACCNALPESADDSAPHLQWCVRETASVIVSATGPSGPNIDYALRLVVALRSAGIRDDYLECLWGCVLVAVEHRDGVAAAKGLRDAADDTPTLNR